MKEQEVVGQESNKATFRNLNSSHHYVVRLRVRSPALGNKRLGGTNPTYPRLNLLEMISWVIEQE